jgi:phosphopentomutase
MRAIILELDSFGIGEAPDAPAFGDQGADTFGHIVAYCAQNNRPLHLPHLHQLGLSAAYELSSGKSLAHPIGDGALIGCYGVASETSLGKDTPSGHWEMAGLPVDFTWGYFDQGFPDALIETFIEQAQLPGVLGLKHASGTEIINELGDEHVRSGKPIVYTSADSVFQVGAHEEIFGLKRLYRICEIARQLVDEYNIGRVIARPFIGQAGQYERTANRRDYAIPPHGATLLDHAKAAGHEVISIGKIADIFAHRGVTQVIKAPE